MARLIWRAGARPARSRFLRGVLWALLAVVLVCAALLAYIAFVFDANSVRPRLTDWVRQKYQRELSVGDIKLKFWPAAHLELADVALTEAGDKRVFAKLRRAAANLRWVPLARGELVVEALTLEGLQLRIARAADGSWNINDLLAPGGAKAPKFDIAQLTLRDAVLSFEDAASAARWQIANLQLSAGPVALGRPGELSAGFDLSGDAARVQAKLSLTAGYSVGAPPSSFEVKRVQLRGNGQVQGAAIEHAELSGNVGRSAAGDWQASDVRASVRAKRGAQREDLQLAFAQLQSKGGEFATPALSAEYRRAEAGGAWQAQIEGPLAYQMQANEWRSPKLRLTAQRERGAQRLRAEGIGELVVRPRDGVWLASDVAFTVQSGAGGESAAANAATGAKSTANVAAGAESGANVAAGVTLHASGQLDARARTRESAYALAFDPVTVTVRKGALEVELASARTATVNVTGDALEAQFDARVRMSDAQHALGGTAQLTLAGAIAQGDYRAQALVLSLSGKRAGAPMKLDVRGDGRANINTQRLEVPSLRAQVALGEGARAQRAQISAGITADGLRRQAQLKLTDTNISIHSSSNKIKDHSIILNGVLDLDWARPQASYRGRARMDASTANGEITWSRAGSASAYRFDLAIDKLDLDRYALRSGTRSAPRTGAKQGTPSWDLAQLRALNAQGVARIGELKSAGTIAKDVKVQIE